MAKLSGRGALFSGIGLIRREPRLLLSLAIVYVLSGILPQALAYWAVWPEVFTAVDAASKSVGAGAGVTEIAQLQSRLLPYQLLAFPFSVAGMIVIYAAIYRAVLEPDRRAFGYLRFGRQEGAMFLTCVAAILLLIVAIAAIALVIVILVMFVRMVSGAASHIVGLATFGLILLAVILAGWGAVRLSLALPMAYADRRFRLFESWALTRGHGWKIFGVWLAMIAIIIGVELVVGLIVILIAVAAGTGLSGQTAAIAQVLSARMAQGAETWIPQVAMLYLGVVTVFSVVTAGIYIFVIAPVADIYRQLTAGAAEVS